MTRLYKKDERRGLNPHKRKPRLTKKTGTKKEISAYKEHTNALEGELASQYFIPKMS